MFAEPTQQIISSVDTGASSCGVADEAAAVTPDAPFFTLPAFSSQSMAVGVTGTFNLNLRDSFLSVVVKLKRPSLDGSFGEATKVIDEASGAVSISMVTSGLPLPATDYYVKMWILPTSKVNDANWYNFALHTAVSPAIDFLCDTCDPPTTVTSTSTTTTTTFIDHPASASTCDTLSWPLYK